MGVTNWETQTDHGYATFEVVDREYIRKLPGGRYIIADADGNRFELPNLRTNTSGNRSQLSTGGITHHRTDNTPSTYYYPECLWTWREF